MSKGTKQRTAAKRIVEQQKAAEKRRTVTIWTTVAVVAALVLAGLIGWGVVSSQRSDTASAAVPSGTVDEGTAFAVGGGPVMVDVYEDFMCPICNEFEKQSGATLQQLISANKVTVRYHPIAILDDKSNGTKYSTRAAGAAAAAAEGGKFQQYHQALFDNQPAEGSDGLDNAKLVELGTSAGLGDAFATAVNDGKYDGWAGKVTDEASKRGVTGTPTVLVNGKQLRNPTPDALTSAVG
ncbi:thioredoxin domain-containing protein [Actinoplanes sp. NBRC 103695]|uniref:DsbA family protein n=1 Tax=Actinoplanes sp. NBRC 103695 TaxID=3032202 RepID=UPI0024A006CD|nr:thioredoxin domain-containing protein [Actinoplanes sp. NBRC 103695]GLY97432.1 membrane protein [Actinoplanes sp. NBRC 103695]